MVSAKTVLRLVGAGFVAGLAVLGVGGRIAMRIVAYTTTEAPEFTLLGTGEVLLIGASWGALTAPLLLLLEPLEARVPRGIGPAFGLLVLSLAMLAVAVGLGFGGRIVAPPAFIALSVVLFPLLFLAHGTLVRWLARRWRLWPKRLARLSEPH